MTQPGSEFQLLTSTQPAAIAIVRLRGPLVATFVDRFLRFRTPRSTMHLRPSEVLRAALLDQDGVAFDEIIVTVREAEPNLELWLHVHGGPWIAARCRELAESIGIRSESPPPMSPWIADEGEIHAAALALLPSILSVTGARWLLSQPAMLAAELEELVALARRNPSQFRERRAALLTRESPIQWFTKPLRVALVGPPNVGKSTLLNALVGQSVSLVSATPGTTRDWVEATTETNGFPMTWIDTAGGRDTTDPLELAGIQRAGIIASGADVVVFVFSADPGEFAANARFVDAYDGPPAQMIVWNKSDRSHPTTPLPRLPQLHACPGCEISAVANSGVREFASKVLAVIGRTESALRMPSIFSDSVRNVVNAVQ